MVAPILLPFLLGATGLGAASLLQPHVQNYGNRVQGRYNRDTLDGVDQSNPQALGSALFGGGLLSGKDYYGGNVDIRNTDANNAARIQSSQITAGPGYQNAALNQQKWAVDPLNPNSPQYQAPQQFDPNNPVPQNYDQWLERQQQLWDMTQPAAPPLDFSDPDKLTAFVDGANQVTSALQTVDDSLDFIRQSGVKEIWNRDDRYALEAQATLTSLPVIAQRIMQAGAMSDEERPIFEKIANMDLSGQLSEKELMADLTALGTVLEKMQRSQAGAFSLSNLGPYADTVGFPSMYQPRNISSGAGWVADDGR